MSSFRVARLQISMQYQLYFYTLKMKNLKTILSWCSNYKSTNKYESLISKFNKTIARLVHQSCRILLKKFKEYTAVNGKIFCVHALKGLM